MTHFSAHRKARGPAVSVLGLRERRLFTIFTGLLIFLLLITAPLPVGARGGEEETDPLTMEWEEIVASARGSEVSFYMWGGSTEINTWIDMKVAEGLKAEYDITLKRVPMDASVFVNKLLAEKQAGREKGVIDLLWINGENFRNAKEAGLLWGPYVQELPNFTSYVDPASAATDFGFPTDGYEAPYGKAWFVFEYDTAKMENPPADFNKLTAWIKANPGRFTYPQPPDFTGSAFLRLAFYHANGGHEVFMDGFDENLAEKSVKPLIAWLEDIEPYLWQEGRSYPRDSAALDALFERGEVDFSMNYNVSHASNKIATGQYPDTVRTFVPEDSALFNLHFTAVPFNSPNKAGALVLSNYLLSPEIQLSKNDPANWGDLTVLDPGRLDAADAAAFSALDQGVATLSLEALTSEAVPEISSEYIEFLESAWDERILRK
jgi:putative spermidine/putrescine transport system substrate-binding protein